MLLHLQSGLWVHNLDCEFENVAAKQESGLGLQIHISFTIWKLASLIESCANIHDYEKLLNLKNSCYEKGSYLC